MSFFVLAWRGEVRLWKAFWLVGILGAAVLAFCFAMLTIAGLVNVRVANVIQAAYSLYASVAVWRAAPNVDLPYLENGVRLLTVIFVVTTLIGESNFFLKGGAEISEARVSITRRCLATVGAMAEKNFLKTREQMADAQDDCERRLGAKPRPSLLRRLGGEF